MKTTPRVYGISAGFVLGNPILVMTPAAAQEDRGKTFRPGAAKSKPQSVPKGGPAPRTADGHRISLEFGSRAPAGGFSFNPAPQKAIRR